MILIMKKIIYVSLVCCIFLIVFSVVSGAQNNQGTNKSQAAAGKTLSKKDTIQSANSKTYLITTAGGIEFIGKIVSQDEKEVLLDAKNRGNISIPKYQIIEMKEISQKELTNGGEYVPESEFASRYFITTNGLPLKKGDNYILWNFYGPDLQFSLSDHFGVGIMTSWVGIPIIGTAKYSFNLGKKTNMAVGTLLGTGSWSLPEFGLAVPFMAVTYGDRRNNINFSGGYGVVWTDKENSGRALLSVAGLASFGRKMSFAFDSFIIPGTSNSSTVSILIPGFRIQMKRGNFFQLGFAGIFDGGEVAAGLPMVQWFRKF